MARYTSGRKRSTQRIERLSYELTEDVLHATGTADWTWFDTHEGGKVRHNRIERPRCELNEDVLHGTEWIIYTQRVTGGK